MSEQSSTNTKLVLVLVGGLIVGFFVGFVLANNINKQEDEKLRGELARLRAGGSQSDSGGGNGSPSRAQGQSGGQRTSAAGDGEFPTLTDEQLRNAVSKADASPSDAELQKKVGQALYVYAWQTSNYEILPDVARILRRAHELDAKDYKTTVMAGDTFFLIARSKDSDPATLADARALYESALKAKPDDVIVRTSLGLTYFYAKPSDARRAIREYRQALKSDPKHEAALQSITLALIDTGDLAEAETRLGELEKVNPSNAELPNLRTQLEQKKNAAGEAR
ncbi:MAG TPA: tetratricopeptide repeat protein [Pyrinomonadaceae bacterium]|nr:tetratricopeptide repeat protein [Pyrinomonadaceae bacterium]